MTDSNRSASAAQMFDALFALMVDKGILCENEVALVRRSAADRAKHGVTINDRDICADLTRFMDRVAAMKRRAA